MIDLSSIDKIYICNGYTDLRKGIDGNGLEYEFIYNDYNYIVQIKVAGTTILSNSYYDSGTNKYSGKINSTTYGSDVISFEYDSENRVKNIKVNGLIYIEYLYDSLGNIGQIIDSKDPNNIVYYNHNYDFENRLVNIIASNGASITYAYDQNGFLSNKTNINGSSQYIYKPIDPTQTGKNENQYLDEEDYSIFSKKYNYTNVALGKISSISIATTSATILSSFTYDSFTKDSVNYETYRIKELVIKKEGVVTPLIKLEYSYNNNNLISQIKRYDNGSLKITETFVYDIYDQITNYLLR